MVQHFFAATQEQSVMRYRTALILALSLGAAASLATPAAKAAGVYVGVGLPAPIYAPPAWLAYRSHRATTVPRHFAARPTMVRATGGRAATGVATTTGTRRLIIGAGAAAGAHAGAGASC